MSWYTTGTISVTNGNATITGTGTAFVANVQPGYAFLGPDYSVYEVLSITNDTTIVLVNNYRGSTVATQPYGIFQTQGIIADLSNQVTTLLNTFGPLRTAIPTILTWTTATTSMFSSGTDFTPGTTTSLTLSRAYTSTAQFSIFFDGVFQGPDQIYSLIGNVVTFTAPIPVGVSKVYERGAVPLGVGTPADASITVPKLATDTLAYFTKAADLIASTGATLVKWIQSGTGAFSRTIDSKLKDSVNVMDYMSDSDRADLLSGSPTLDHSAALVAAIAALPATGGTVTISVPRFPCNITITNNGVTLKGDGQGTWLGSGSNYRGLVPYNLSLPVLTVGDDTKYVSGTRLENITISSPTGLGLYGLKLYGGTYGFSASGLTINGFKSRCLWVENGPNYPATYITISNFSFFTSSSATSTDAAVYFKYATSGASSFATALFLSNGNIGSASSVARQVWLDGTEISTSNVYIQCPASHTGIYCAKTYSGAQTPLMFCNNTTIDTDNSANILLDYTISASTNISDAIRGTCNFNGQMQNSASTNIASPFASNYTLAAYNYNPVVGGSQTFPDKANWADTSCKLNGVGAAGSRGLEIYGATFKYWPGTGGYAQFSSPVGDSTATFRLYDQLNNRTTSLTCEAGTLHLASFGGGRAIKLGDAAWNGQPVGMGGYFLWVDSSGRLRIKSGAPSSDTDGTVVGTQS